MSLHYLLDNISPSGTDCVDFFLVIELSPFCQQVLRGGVMTLIRLTVAMAAERIRKSFTTVQMYLSRMGPEIMISLSNNSTTNN